MVWTATLARRTLPIGDSKETTLESTIRASVVSNKLVTQFLSQNLIPNF